MHLPNTCHSDVLLLLLLLLVIQGELQCPVSVCDPVAPHCVLPPGSYGVAPQGTHQDVGSD